MIYQCKLLPNSSPLRTRQPESPPAQATAQSAIHIRPFRQTSPSRESCISKHYQCTTPPADIPTPVKAAFPNITNVRPRRQPIFPPTQTAARRHSAVRGQDPPSAVRTPG